MANLGTDPELERELFCAGCLSGTTHPGQVISYDRTEVLRLREAGEVKHGERCVRCGAPMAGEADEAEPEPAATEPAVTATEPAEPTQETGRRRARSGDG